MVKKKHYLKLKKKTIWLLVSLFLITWIVFFDNYSIITRYKLYTKKNQLLKQIKHIEYTTDSLDQKIETLKKIPIEIETMARELYGLRRKGEIVIKIVHKKKNKY